MSAAKWKIDHGLFKAKVEVNGQDVSDIARSATLFLAHGQVPTLTLELRGSEGSIEGEGIVEVGYDRGLNLDDLDPEEIEGEALSRQQWGDDKTLTEHILDVIREKMSQ